MTWISQYTPVFRAAQAPSPLRPSPSPHLCATRKAGREVENELAPLVHHRVAGVLPGVRADHQSDLRVEWQGSASIHWLRITLSHQTI